MRKIVALILIAGLQFVNCNLVSAQCAMCKSVVGSNKDAGGNMANGLNTGILYLMAVPYILLAILAIYVFRVRIVQKFPALKGIFNLNDNSNIK